MKATEQHRKYVDDLTSLMDQSGNEMSNFVMRVFKTALKSTNDPMTFVRSIRNVKPRLSRALSKKAMETANKAFDLGKKFAREKK